MVNKNLKTPVFHTNNVFKLKPMSACVRAVITGGVFIGSVSPVLAELPMAAAQWTNDNVTREVVGGTMNINQFDPNVTLNWDKFNVGETNTVNFKQPDANSIAVNNIRADDGAPSQILGQVNANGRIYLINENGFVFGRNSVVDTHGLVASTLRVADKAIEDGITKVANKDGIASFEGNGEFYMRNGDGSFQLNGEGKKIPIAVQVEEGAQIKSADGHPILIMAPTIINKGHVESDGGQVIMAAATDKVYLQEAPVDTSKGQNPPVNSDVRGLLVEVKTGGKVENLGSIAANRGNVTLMGFAVNQEGKVSATTSINENGTIRLLAREGGSALPNAQQKYDIGASSTRRLEDNGDGLGTTAKVTLGSRSTTEILPEVQYVEGVETRAVNGQAQPQSRLEIMANNVHMVGGAQIVVPSGKVSVTATGSPEAPMIQGSDYKDSTSDIKIEGGVKIDVSGLDATRTMESNIISVKLQSNQFKDSPVQKTGVLFGKTVQVDIRAGTTLADVQAEINAVTYTLAERLGAGGSIVLNAERSVDVGSGSVLDISGGVITYLGGEINTTQLVSKGVIYDIADADPLMTFDGVYGEYTLTDEKWLTTETWFIDSPLAIKRYEPGYIEGRNAGSLIIGSNNISLNAELLGQAVIGRTQRSLSGQPSGGQLEISMQLSPDVIRNIVFAENNLAEALSIKPDMLVKSGIQKAAFKTNGKISLARDSNLQLLQAGSLTLEGGEIDIEGAITGAGAEVGITTALTGGTLGILDGHVNIASSASLDLQGHWINDSTNPGNIEDGLPLSIDGGKIKVLAEGDVNVMAGSVIDVSGGAWVGTKGKIVAGKAGEITLAAAKRNSEGSPAGSNLTLEGTLKGYGLENGGKLSVETNQVQIAGELKANQADGLRPLHLDNEFFSSGGFADYVVTSNTNGLTVSQNALLNLVQQNRMLNSDFLNQANAKGIAALSSVITLLPETRKASSLTLNANHSVVSNEASHLVVESGSRIVADDLSKISLVSDSSIAFDGSITTRGGQVLMEITTPQDPSDPFYRANQSLWIGRRAEIDVSGSSNIITDRLGNRVGDVYDGGLVSLIANRGFIVTQSGSLINVAGTQDTLDLPVLSDNGLSYRETSVGSNGGELNILAAEGVFLDGDILARAGNGLGTAGGTLSLAIDRTKRNEPFGNDGGFSYEPRTLIVRQNSEAALISDMASAGDQAPAGSKGMALVTVEKINQAGFSSVSLHADQEIRFQGQVDLELGDALKLDAPKFSAENVGGDVPAAYVNLQATSVAMGSFQFAQTVDEPVAGNGVLNVNADLIDLKGYSVASGFRAVNLHADQDIRLQGNDLKADLKIGDQAVGVFKTASELTLTADRVFPATLTKFTLAVSGDPAGKIVFSSNNGDKPAPVLSAYGNLTVNAPNIEQNGNIMAPFGAIVLQAEREVSFGAQSRTSVSGQEQLIPFGVTASAGLDWLYPTVNDQRLVISAPQKRVTITADRVSQADGALIDLSGGGDIMAYEFLPGLGGSKDVLDTAQAFAVLPGFAGYAPLDPIETAKSGLKVGDTIHIAGGSDLAAGEYTLLPAHYALLPGAYLITPQASSGVVAAGWASNRIDNAAIVSGYRGIAGTDIFDQRLSAFVVEPGSIALTRSELKRSYGNEFFAANALKNEQATPRLPQDAGQLVVDVKSYLDLPTLNAGGTLGAQLDISSDHISVVNSQTGAPGMVELLASDIDKFNVQSLFLGGTRSIETVSGNTVLNVKASSVTVAENVKLSASEIILGGSGRVELKAGARLEAKGEAGAGRKTLLTTGDSALVRVSAGEQAILQRSGASGAAGDLLVEEGAVLAATGGSILLDSTHDSRLDGEFSVSGGSLNIGAELINLGETADINSGLSLSNSLLSRLAQTDLVLSSRGSINLYGSLSPAQFGNLVLNSSGLAGFNNAGKTVEISAKSLTLANYANVAGNTGNGDGRLVVNTENLLLDGGDYKISGFENVRFNVGESVTGTADTQLTMLANTELTARVMTGDSLVKTTIDATGYDLQLNSAGVAGGVYDGVGAQLLITADSVDVNTHLIYRAGKVEINALSLDASLGAGTLIDVSGIQVDAGLSAPALVGAGQVYLKSQQRNVLAETGSRMFLNAGVPGMAAGGLRIEAAQGQAKLNGLIDAHGVTGGGRIQIDVKNLGDNGFSGVNAIALAGGFTEGFDLRLREGDVLIQNGQTVHAHSIAIAADTGRLTVEGLLDANGSSGGAIVLSAEDALILAATGRLSASAQTGGGDGGTVRLASLDKDADGAGVEIISGSQIDVGNLGGETGAIWLRADRLDSNGDGIVDVNVKTVPAGSVVGNVTPFVEAVKVYDKTASPIITTANINTYKTETNNYMNTLINNNVVRNQFADSFKVVPGIEVRSKGNLTLNGVWDFATWRYGAEKLPGVLTLRAAGNVAINNDLTDGFAAGSIKLSDIGAPNVSVSDMLQTGQSWSYNVAAGADLAAADQRTVIADTGDMSLLAAKKIRTGTGSIDVQAGNDIKYGSEKSAIYTAGRAVAEATEAAARWGFKRALVGTRFYTEYPVDGGDITLAAGRDIIGKPTTQLVTDWLLRTGNWSTKDTHTGERPTAWGITLSNWGSGAAKTADYRQSVGALGGGNVKITAGGNISDLSVVIPTTGKQVGEYAVAVDNSSSTTLRKTESDFNYKTNVVQVNGGGNLDLSAGGNVAGGFYYVDNGAANIRAGGALTAGNNIGAGASTGLNPILGLGDAQFTVVTGKDLNVASVVDPMLLPQGKKPDTTSLFFRYSADSALSMRSLAGNVTVENDSEAILNATNLNWTANSKGSDQKAFNVYPATLKIDALAGDAMVMNSIYMYPGARGDLEIFAYNNILSGPGENAIQVVLGDTDPNFLPSVLVPKTNFLEADGMLTGLTSFATQPVHTGDTRPVLISTAKGNMQSGNTLSFNLAKPALIRSGKDITGVSFQIQHNDADSHSIISAERDIRYKIERNELTGTLRAVEQKIAVSGPGLLTLVSGRDIDLGSSDGVTSIGNTLNPNLPENGANLTVMAGMAGGRINVDGFAKGFVVEPSAKQAYTDHLVAYLRQYTGDQDISPEQASALLEALPAQQRSLVELQMLPYVQAVYFKTLKNIAQERAASTLTTDKDRLELQMVATIEKLFPGTTLLAGNTDYSYDPISGLQINDTTSAGEIIRNMDVKLLEAIKERFGNTIDLDPKNTGLESETELNIDEALQTIVGASDSGFGKETVRKIFNARQDIKDAIRPSQGDISLFFSRIHTTDGGNLDLITPNGGINAGLAVTSKDKDDSKVGIVLQGQGDSHATVRDDFAVNLARYMTLKGGDIVAGSSEGSMNAGRGATQVGALAPPEVSYDKFGQPVIVYPPAIGVSGIRSTSPSGIKPGDVALFAPRGVIDAGEAGIAAQNLIVDGTLANSSNVSVGGVSTGVPTAPSTSISAGLAGASGLAASATKSIESVTDVAKENAESRIKATSALGILNVEVLGFGD